MKKWIIVSVAALALASAAQALAQDPGGGRRERGPEGVPPPEGMWNHPRALERLNLTKEQQNTLASLRYEHQKQMIDLRADVEKANLDVRRLMDEDQPSERAVLQAVEKAGAAQTDLRKAQVEHLLKVRSIIGTEKWKELRQDAGKRVRDTAGEGERPGRARAAGGRMGQRRPTGERGALPADAPQPVE